MNSVSGKNKAAAAAIAFLAAIFTAGPACAQTEKIDVKVGGKSLAVESKDVRVGDVYVAAGDTFSGDLVAKSGTVTVDGVVDGDCVTFGGSMVINGQVLGEAAVFGGPVQVNGSIEDDLAAFGGPVTVSGKVGGEIASFGGPVRLLATAVVDGDVSVMGAQVERSDSAQVNGEINNISLGMMNRFLPGAVSVAQTRTPLLRLTRFFIALVWVAASALLVLLTVLFFPRSVERIARAVELDIWKSVGVGLLAQVAVIPGIILMAVSILGIPLIPLAILAFIAAAILGFAGFCLLAAQRLFAAGHRPAASTVPMAMIGFLALNALLLAGHLINIPGAPFNILGWILVIANFSLLWFASTVGLGAVWSTRFGSREETAPAAPVVKV
jgi:cytoskeletal protein CcmA (bactofilin family)